MRNDKRLPDAELEVMQTIWSLGTQVTAAEVQQHADKDWKMTSVLTFLSRLCDKGFLSCTKEGRQNLYTPLVSEEEFSRKTLKGVVSKYFDNSYLGVVSSLVREEKISVDDLRDLIRQIESQTEKR
jgi:BlaI family penicillinase repressor